MPDVEYTTVVNASIERVWEYVEDLSNWSHLMVGFQNLEIVDDRRSVWTLRGDVGILSREVRIQADITEWVPRERVTFVVTGLTERLEGGGSFLLAPATRGGRSIAPTRPGTGTTLTTGANDASGTAGTVSAVESPGRAAGPLRRLRFTIARWILRRIGRRANTQPRPAPIARVREDTAGDGSTESSSLTFELRIHPLGPMAPMIELLMSPMLEPAAKDLADGIRAEVEA